jgi:hypothetical protein
LVLVIAFAVFFFVSYVPGEEQKDLQEEQQKAALEKQRQLQKKLDDEKAREAIIADSERRKKLREEREAREKELKIVRDQMKERYDKARGEFQSLERDNRRLESEIDEEKRLLDRAKAEQAGFEKEKAALREYVRQADSNAKRLQDLLQKINDVEVEKAKQAALAAAAPKGGSN